MNRLYRYEICNSKYIEHPYNLGYLYSNNLHRNIINKWVDEQREYIQNLSLEEKCSILLWIKHPEIYTNIDVKKAIDLVIKSKYHEIHPDEDLPIPSQLSRYIFLLKQIIDNAPVLLFSIQLFKNNQDNQNNKYFNELYFEPRENFNFDTLNIKKNTRCLYIGSSYDGDILFSNQLINYDESLTNPIINKIIPLTNDEIYLNNAIKETIEEAGIDFSKIGVIEGYIDFPLYLQVPYIDNTGLKYFKIDTVHGTSASGSTILCREDRTILGFVRQGKDFNMTIAGVGGSIGESDTKVYNSKFNYRSYIVNVTKEEKKYINQTIKLNHESLLAVWLSLDEMIEQVSSLNNGNNHINDVDKYITNLTTPISYDDCIIMFRKGSKQGKIFIYMAINSDDIVSSNDDIVSDKNYYLVIPSLSYIINNLFEC